MINKIIIFYNFANFEISIADVNFKSSLFKAYFKSRMTNYILFSSLKFNSYIFSSNYSLKSRLMQNKDQLQISQEITEYIPILGQTTDTLLLLIRSQKAHAKDSVIAHGAWVFYSRHSLTYTTINEERYGEH